MSGEYLFGYLMAAVCFALLSWVECSGHRQPAPREQGQKELDALRLKMDAHRPKLSAWYI